MEIIQRYVSKDGSIKYLQKISGELAIETSFFDRENKFVICYSSQIGCPNRCIFCKTGLLPLGSKYQRSLTLTELVDQCLNVYNDCRNTIGLKPNKPTLFSCMGGGEPFLNYDNVVACFHELEKIFPNLRQAVSTSGIKPMLIRRFAHEEFKARLKLQISLHAADDETRSKLVPNNRPLLEIVNAGNYYIHRSGRSVSWNYILFNGVNDSEQDARRLGHLLKSGSTVKFSCYNPVAGCILTPSQLSTLDMFMEILKQHGMKTKYFVGNGLDIEASCGTLTHRYITQHQL